MLWLPAVRWLALIPFLRCLHSFLADALSGAGLQRTRTAIQVLAALINIALNLVILPRYSWRGAAWTSLGCDGLLVVVFWFTVLYYRRREVCPVRMLSRKQARALDHVIDTACSNPRSSSE